MRINKATMAVLATFLLCGTAMAQDDSFTALKKFDFQDPPVLPTLYKQIQAALNDKTQLPALENGLIGVLEDPNATFASKQEACRMLWIIGTGRSVPVLSKMLGDEKLQNAARYALERNTDPSAAKALRDALPKVSEQSTVGIINSIGDRADPEAVTVLKGLTANGLPAISEAAIVALGKIGTPDAVMVLEELLQKQTAIDTATIHRNLLTYQALLRAADQLNNSGKKADSERVYLELSTVDKPATVQIAALRGMTAAKLPSAAKTVLAGLKSQQPQVRMVAAAITGTLTDSAITKQAIALYPNLLTSVQIPLLAGWTARREMAATAAAESASLSGDTMLRVTGIKALAVLSGAKSVPSLATFATTGDNEIKQAARTALTQMPGKDADRAILDAADRGEMPVRRTMVDVLADRGTKSDVAYLTTLMTGKDETLATAALKAVVRAGVPTDPLVVIDILIKTPSDSVRDAAQAALVADTRNAVKTSEWIAGLLPKAPSASKPVLLNTLAQLGGDKSLIALTDATKSTDAAVKGAVVTALSDTWNDSRALPVLMTIAKSDTEKGNRVQALRGALRLIGQDDKMPVADKVGKLQEAMTVAERPEEKKQVLGILRECRIEASIALAAKALDDAAVSDEAADTILYLATPQKKGDNTVPAVKGTAATDALNKLIKMAKDESIRTQAQKLL